MRQYFSLHLLKINTVFSKFPLVHKYFQLQCVCDSYHIIAARQWLYS